jgi:hypothetical protein
MMRMVTMMAWLSPTLLAAWGRVIVGRSFGWEEDHVIGVTQRHELQALNQITVPRGSGAAIRDP